MAKFDQLLAEGSSAPINGWDFSWLDGRATEERPTWRYFDRVAERAVGASAMVDLQAGDARMLGDLPALPALAVATEGYPPNVLEAARRLARRPAHVVWSQEDRPALPFAADSFDLVTSRHPVDTWWDEIARILAPGGTYLSQQVGPHSLRDLTEHFTGPLPPGSKREPSTAQAAAEDAGLIVQDLRVERLRTVFYDVAAVVYFLRLVVWIVPGFDVGRHRERLRLLHEQIERHGSFETTSSRFLIEASKPMTAGADI